MACECRRPVETERLTRMPCFLRSR